MREHGAELATVLLLALMAANMLSALARKGLTIDETSAIPAGYYHLVAGAFHVNSEHPPLPKMLAAVPLLFIQPEEPPLESNQKEAFSQRTISTAERFWRANCARFGVVSFWTRVPMVALTLALGALIFHVTRELFGKRAAVLAVALFSFEPNILAHGRIAKDIYVALAYLFAAYAIYAYANGPTLRRAALLGLAAGLAPVVKFSMGILAPVLVVLAITLLVIAPHAGRTRREIALQLALVVSVALLIINAAYLFEHQALTETDVRWLAENAPRRFDLLMGVLRLLSWIVPPYFVFGIYATLVHNEVGHSAFLLGQYSETGWWYYFPVTFALKTTLPFLLLTIAALAWGLWRFAARRDLRFMFLLLPIILYGCVAMSAQLNIGIRHLLPVFPFLFIMGGALLERLLRLHRLRIAVLLLVAASFGWMSYEALRAYPDYIPYMNELASAHPRWHYLSDSNVEWGDDAPALAAYLRARGERRVRAAFLGGARTLPCYGVEYVDLLSPPEVSLPETSYVAIGASFLNGSTVPGWSEGSGRATPAERHDFFAAYRNLQPEAVFGHSIYLYRVRE